MFRALQRDPGILADRQRLWKIGAGRLGKRENGQLDVVVSLWEAGMLA
jgi:hypothetical protein